jgi:hypothetical protein
MATKRTVQELRDVLEKIDLDQMDRDDFERLNMVLSKGMEKIREKQRDLAYDVLPWTRWKERLFWGEDHFDMFIDGTKLLDKDDGRIFYQFEPVTINKEEILYLADLVKAGWHVTVDPLSNTLSGWSVAVVVSKPRELTADLPATD